MDFQLLVVGFGGIGKISFLRPLKKAAQWLKTIAPYLNSDGCV